MIPFKKQFTQLMKSFMKPFILALVSALPVASFAQKIAYLEVDSLIALMPEMEAAKKTAAEHYKSLEGTLSSMQKELNDKITEYQSNEKNYTDLIKQTKQKELQDLDQRIKDFQMQAQSDFQKKNEELTRPINQKAKKAIEKVAKAKGYKLVMDSSSGTLVYKDPADDIFNLVKAELGLK
jgi:outer membrane protein